MHKIVKPFSISQIRHCQPRKAIWSLSLWLDIRNFVSISTGVWVLCFCTEHRRNSTQKAWFFFFLNLSPKTSYIAHWEWSERDSNGWCCYFCNQISSHQASSCKIIYLFIFHINWFCHILWLWLWEHKSIFFDQSYPLKSYLSNRFFFFSFLKCLDSLIWLTIDVWNLFWQLDGQDLVRLSLSGYGLV